uniref:Cation/H+ exchanger domain-containing protein n=1 Tax=Ciona savignyi TaxID=51511 RepID=H2YWT7_CIOSA
FMIAAVSPAVVIPSLIILQDKGLGVAKGVPSLVMAASGIDDVLAIAGFTVLLGLAIPTGLEEEIESFISQTFAIIEIIIGIISGLVLGMLISYIPSKKMRYRAANVRDLDHVTMCLHVHFCRGFLLLTIGIVFVFGTELWGIPGAGALCALVTSFTASLQWKEETVLLHLMDPIHQAALGSTAYDQAMRLGRPDNEVYWGQQILVIAVLATLITAPVGAFGIAIAGPKLLTVGDVPHPHD